MKKIATVEEIAEVLEHTNADSLELVKVLGYQCVVRKGLYKPGDVIVYIQPDSVLPEQEWCLEYRKYSPKRVKAVKLRNEWSEGIIVPIDLIQHIIGNELFISQNVSELLNVYHYEPPAPVDLQAKGGMPYQIPKTDEERWENMVKKLPLGEKVDITLKRDGQSASYYYHNKDNRLVEISKTVLITHMQS